MTVQYETLSVQQNHESGQLPSQQGSEKHEKNSSSDLKNMITFRCSFQVESGNLQILFFVLNQIN
jgi:hypothetical protein